MSLNPQTLVIRKRPTFITASPSCPSLSKESKGKQLWGSSYSSDTVATKLSLCDLGRLTGVGWGVGLRDQTPRRSLGESLSQMELPKYIPGKASSP